MDKSVTAVVIQGLAEHKDSLGAPLCPCRHYDDKEAEAAQGYWNCPCVPMRERKVRDRRWAREEGGWCTGCSMGWCHTHGAAEGRHPSQGYLAVGL